MFMNTLFEFWWHIPLNYTQWTFKDIFHTNQGHIQIVYWHTRWCVQFPLICWGGRAEGNRDKHRKGPALTSTWRSTWPGPPLYQKWVERPKNRCSPVTDLISGSPSCTLSVSLCPPTAHRTWLCAVFCQAAAVPSVNNDNTPTKESRAA